MKEKKQALLRLAEEKMAVPTGTFSDTPCFELYGRDRVRIEGRFALRGCEEAELLLETSVGAVRLRGASLCVVSFSENGMELTGQMLSLEFLG